MSEQPPKKGLVAALDLGKARVGLAISDELWSLAHPRPSLDGRNRKELLKNLAKWAQKEHVARFLVGQPLALSGRAGVAAQRAARFCQPLADATGVDVELVDERWTTVEAEHRLRETGTPRQQIRQRVDGASAAIVLQQWLDAHRRDPDPKP